MTATDLRRHMLNARLCRVGRSDEGRGVYTIEKAGPGRLVDACVAAMLAFEATTQIAPLVRPIIEYV